jgi:hypothetical protein
MSRNKNSSNMLDGTFFVDMVLLYLAGFLHGFFFV